MRALIWTVVIVVILCMTINSHFFAIAEENVNEQHEADFPRPEIPKEVDEILTAATEGDISKVVELLDERPDSLVNLRDERGFTSLHMAVANQHEQVVDELINRGADVNLPEDDGWTPLMFAAYNVGYLVLYIFCFLIDKVPTIL
jgi:ankyrin repeat protein